MIRVITMLELTWKGLVRNENQMLIERCHSFGNFWKQLQRCSRTGVCHSCNRDHNWPPLPDFPSTQLIPPPAAGIISALLSPHVALVILDCSFDRSIWPSFPGHGSLQLQHRSQPHLSMSLVLTMFNISPWGASDQCMLPAPHPSAKP